VPIRDRVDRAGARRLELAGRAIYAVDAVAGSQVQKRERDEDLD
jgi:hypothetical protein